MKHIPVTLGLAVIILGMPLLPVLAQTAGKAPDASPAVMSAMMETCQKNCVTMAGRMDELTKTLDAAKASNDATKLREALDQVHTTIAKMQTEAKDCNAVMEHMHQMMSMSGSASH